MDQPFPPQLEREWAGPRGVALVRAFPDGKTDPGWGLTPGKGQSPDQWFIPKYLRGDFDARRVLWGYDKGYWAFAVVMRSTRLVAIDIDGKNGGLEHAKRLGALPPTLAETSKSGTGYHLFYLVDEEWDPDRGFATLSDRIGIEQGVDIRATGCVYHHPQQRWNHRMPVKLPEHLFEILKNREQKLQANNTRIIQILDSNEDWRIAMLHDEIIARLNKPIPQGKRNNTLFAIGCEMQAANVPDWPNLLAERALQVGLPQEEVDKLVRNVDRYALAGVTP